MAKVTFFTNQTKKDKTLLKDRIRSAFAAAILTVYEKNKCKCDKFTFSPIFTVHMALFRFRVYWEEDDLVYRDIEIRPTQTFLEFHKAIITAYEFDGKHAASFFDSNEKWNRNREINSEVLVNKREAPALSMMRTPVSALVTTPDHKFVYEYDPVKKWTFLVELIGVTKEEDSRRTYPFVLRKEGVAPAQYGVKGVNLDKLMEVEEKYDLVADEMAEGFGNEGEESGEETGFDTGGSDSFEE